MGALDPAQPEDPSECPPSAAPAHLLPGDFRENPRRATQVFQSANVGRAQSDDAPGNAATLHGAHESGRTRSFGTSDSRSGWAYSQHPSPQSRKTSLPLWPRKPSSFGMSSCTEPSCAPDLHQFRHR